MQGPPRPPGQAVVGHSPDRQRVAIDFGSTGAWSWVEFSPGQARAVALALLKHADHLDGALTTAILS